jgi:hypothetical protein
MSGFHTATLCSVCDPPVVAVSTGYGSRCPRCGQTDEGSADQRKLQAEISNNEIARQIIKETSVRSDSDARLLADIALRLLKLSVGTTCPHCQLGEPSVWDADLEHYAHPRTNDKLVMCHEPWRLRCTRCSAGLSSMHSSCAECT